MTDFITVTAAADTPPLSFPAFDAFPFLVTKIAGPLHHFLIYPSERTDVQLRRLALRQTRANRLPACLALGPGRYVWITPEGRHTHKAFGPATNAPAAGRLRPPEVFPATPDLLARIERLRRYIEGHARDLYLLGDPTHGGRRATPSEALRLAGRQRGGGVPRGLTRCPECGRWRGECLGTCETTRDRVVRVCCPCENDNRCAACGQPLYASKLNADRYDESDGQLWHVPGFCGLHHRCDRRHLEE